MLETVWVLWQYLVPVLQAVHGVALGACQEACVGHWREIWQQVARPTASWRRVPPNAPLARRFEADHTKDVYEERVRFPQRVLCASDSLNDRRRCGHCPIYISQRLHQVSRGVLSIGIGEVIPLAP